jgi:hypothetical protein
MRKVANIYTEITTKSDLDPLLSGRLSIRLASFEIKGTEVPDFKLIKPHA